MQNYEAILTMNQAQMEAFLDEVYCTGLNNGLYAARQSAETADALLEENPFNSDWLAAEAEPATRGAAEREADVHLLDALCEAVLRNAGIQVTESVRETKSKKTVSIEFKKEF